MQQNLGVNSYPGRPDSFPAEEGRQYTPTNAEAQWQWDRDAQQMSPQLYSDGHGGLSDGLPKFKTLIYLAGPEYAAKYKTLIYLAGSASAEVIADVALCPLEAVKVRVQTQPGFARGLSDGLPKFIKSDGIGGLYRGLGPLWGRQIP